MSILDSSSHFARRVCLGDADRQTKGGAISSQHGNGLYGIDDEMATDYHMATDYVLVIIVSKFLIIYVHV